MHVHASALEALEDFHKSLSHLEIWTLFCDPLISGTRLFGAWLAREVQEY